MFSRHKLDEWLRLIVMTELVTWKKFTQLFGDLLVKDQIQDCGHKNGQTWQTKGHKPVNKYTSLVILQIKLR